MKNEQDQIDVKQIRARIDSMLERSERIGGEIPHEAVIAELRHRYSCQKH